MMVNKILAVMSKGMLTVCLVFAVLNVNAATQAEIDAAQIKIIAWLVSNQNGDGSWRSGNDNGIQATAAALETLSNAGIRGAPYARGLAWLANTEAYSVDSLSRQIKAMFAGGLNVQAKINQLISWRNQNFTWGSYDQYATSFPDTPLASSAIRTDSSLYSQEQANLLTSICGIVQAQRSTPVNNAGSWAYTPAFSNAVLTTDNAAILPTVLNILELQAFIDLGYSNIVCSSSSYSLNTAITNGINWLLTYRSRSDGGFSEIDAGVVGSPLETAYVYKMLSVLRPADAATLNAQDYLINQIGLDGGINNSALITAAVGKTFVSTVMIDTDKDSIPDLVELELGTNPFVDDSRQHATGNGQAVVWLTKPAVFQAAVNSNNTFLVDLKNFNVISQVNNLPLFTGLVYPGVPAGNPGGIYYMGDVKSGQSKVAMVETGLANPALPWGSTEVIQAQLVSGQYCTLVGGGTSTEITILPGEDYLVAMKYDAPQNSSGLAGCLLRVTLSGYISVPGYCGSPAPPGCTGTKLINEFDELIYINVVSDGDFDVLAVNTNRLYISDGGLPPGYVYNSSTGEITGNSSVPGTYNFTFSSTDGDGSYVGQIIIEEPLGIAGDVSGDGSINASDVLLLQRHIYGSITLDPVSFSRADLFVDGVLNIQDLLLLQKIALSN